MIRGGVSSNRLDPAAILSYFAAKSTQKRTNGGHLSEKVHMPAEKPPKLAKCGTGIKAWDLGYSKHQTLPPIDHANHLEPPLDEPRAPHNGARPP